MKKYSALLAGLMITLVPLASAGTIGINDGTLIIGTEHGDGSQAIVASLVGSDLLVTAANFDLVTPGCTGSGTFTCALSGFHDLVVLGGDGDDVITLAGITAPTFGVTILGGAGADVLVGSGGADDMFGDAGDDILIGGPGVDCLFGGSGDNVLIQGAGGGSSHTCPTTEPVFTPLPRPSASAVPEPGGLWLLATGIAALPLLRRRAKRA